MAIPVLLTGPALGRRGEVHPKSIPNLVKRGIIAPVAVASDGTRLFSEEAVPIVRAEALKFRARRKPR